MKRCTKSRGTEWNRFAATAKKMGNGWTGRSPLPFALRLESNEGLNPASGLELQRMPVTSGEMRTAV